MLASMLASILSTLLVASVVSAQVLPSVVTSLSITPSPASEELFTIQTSVPPNATPACDCIQEPCLACSSEGGFMSIPAGETPIPTANLPSASTTAQSAFPSIPAGETPISTGSLDLPVSGTSRASPTPSGSATPSRSAPSQQTTNAAVPALNRDRAAMALGLLGAAGAFF